MINMLPVDSEDEGYRFYKTLHEDIQLIPNEHMEFDMNFSNGDIVNVTGHDSLRNAIIIAIMTRYQELNHNQLYSDFGCRVHELIKDNKSLMLEYKMKLFIETVLKNMRRVKSINWINITDNPDNCFEKYHIDFSVNSITDELVEGSVNL